MSDIEFHVGYSNCNTGYTRHSRPEQKELDKYISGVLFDEISMTQIKTHKKVWISIWRGKTHSRNHDNSGNISIPQTTTNFQSFDLSSWCTAETTCTVRCIGQFCKKTYMTHIG